MADEQKPKAPKKKKAQQKAAGSHGGAVKPRIGGATSGPVTRHH